MHIALLGGAFNPPHIGHILIARQVLDFAGVDEVWLMPNFNQSPPKPVAPSSDRLAMTEMIQVPKTKVSTLEIDYRLDGRTVNLLPHLPEGNDYSFIIGSDQLSSFHLWGSYRELLGKIPFLVFPRYGFPNEPLYENMKVITHPQLIGSNISSTKIRERVKLGLSVSEFVPNGVAEYIKEHGLYKD